MDRALSSGRSLQTRTQLSGAGACLRLRRSREKGQLPANSGSRALTIDSYQAVESLKYRKLMAISADMHAAVGVWGMPAFEALQGERAAACQLRLQGFDHADSERDRESGGQAALGARYEALVIWVPVLGAELALPRAWRKLQPATPHSDQASYC